MSVLILPLALVLPALCGWLGLRIVEGKHPVLFAAERWVMGLLVGLTTVLFVQFLLQVTLGVPFSAVSFFGTQAIIATGLGAWWHQKRASLPPSPAMPEGGRTPRLAKILLGILLVWTAAKLAFITFTFLLAAPSYLQDTLSNWNLRGKVYFETQELTLVMPNEDPLTSPKGVSSYPPTVPLSKTMLASYYGTWSEPLINSIHIVWYLCAAAMTHFALRRWTGRGWAWLGTYVIGSLPLYLMHGANPYADAFVSAHVFAAVYLLFIASRSTDEDSAASALRLAAFAGGLLTFTKNEGMLVFLPPFVIAYLLTLWKLRGSRVMDMQRIWRNLLGMVVGIACIAGPWLLFKWMNDLTFGNGKPFTSLGFGWQENVLYSIIVNTFSEGNWLLLFPLFFGLLAWRWKESLGWLLVPSAYFLIVYVGQAMLYLFTGLSREALMQTGYARGIIQLTPLIVVLTVCLAYSIRERISDSLSALAFALGLKRE